MKVLIVDDNPEKVSRIKYSIQNLAFDCEVLISVEETSIGGLKALENTIFDLLILDVQLPWRKENDVSIDGGVTFLKKLSRTKKLNTPPHIIGLSAYEGSNEITKAFEGYAAVVISYSAVSDHWESILANKIEAISQHSCQEQDRRNVVALIHGIRTNASWFELVSKELGDKGIESIPIKYGFFDGLSFLCPIITRNAPIKKIQRE